MGLHQRAFLAGAGPLLRHGGECFGKAVVSFAPTSASGHPNETFAAIPARIIAAWSRSGALQKAVRT
jgi:hypothetical protein